MHAVGLDIGGSKTHAVSCRPAGSDRRECVEAYAASANIASVGEAAALDQLDAVIAGLAAQGHDGTPDVVCAGAAGVDTPASAARLLSLLAGRFPGARVTVVHDTHLVLAAADVATGIAVISGTGSVAWGRTADGRTARAGGWGYLLGDEGSGYAVARDAVCHVLDRADRCLPADLLGRRLLADCGLTAPGELLDAFYARVERRYWAHRSTVVLTLAEEGDPEALRLVAGASKALGRIVRRVHSALGEPVASPVVLGGGLLVNQPLLQEALRTELAVHGLTDVRVLHRDPAHGALRLALDTPTQERADHAGHRR